MASLPQTQALLERVARRKRWSHFGRAFARATGAFLGLFLIVLLVARLTAVIPGGLIPWLLPLTLPLSALLAWYLHQGVSPDQAARMIDRFRGNHDLFLTSLHLDDSAGAYQEGVRRRAEIAAGEVPRPREWLPWHRGQPLFKLGALFLIALAATLWLPQWDPFGKDDERQWLGRQAERLEQLRQENAVARSALEDAPTAERKEAIQNALTELQTALTLPKHLDREEISRQLQESQAELGRFWKQLDDEKLRDSLEEAERQSQALGRDPAALTPEAKNLRDQWRKMIREGDTAALEKAIASLLEKAESLNDTSSGESERERGIKDLEDSLQALAQAISGASSAEEALKDTLQRAIEQMQLAQNSDLTGEALEGAQESMEQWQRQLEALGENLQQLQQLDEALSAAQLAQRLNSLGKLPAPGEEKGSGRFPQTLKDYAELYQELLAQASQGDSLPGGGQGQGMKGPGTGEGGVAPEDDSLETDFTKETSPSHLVAGRTLLEWQTQGVSETGQAREAYRDSLDRLKQGLNKAIRQERVPSAYHKQIKTYFDAIDAADNSSADGDGDLD